MHRGSERTRLLWAQTYYETGWSLVAPGWSIFLYIFPLTYFSNIGRALLSKSFLHCIHHVCVLHVHTFRTTYAGSFFVHCILVYFFIVLNVIINLIFMYLSSKYEFLNPVGRRCLPAFSQQHPKATWSSRYLPLAATRWSPASPAAHACRSVHRLEAILHGDPPARHAPPELPTRIQSRSVSSPRPPARSFPLGCCREAARRRSGRGKVDSVVHRGGTTATEMRAARRRRRWRWSRRRR